MFSGLALRLRRPLLLVFVLGCAVSAVASGRFSARLIADGAVSFAFIPAIEIAAFAAVYRTSGRPRLPFVRALDLFFAGNTPWLVWLTGVAIAGCLLSSRQIVSWILPFELAGILTLVWSIHVDFRFFRDVMGRPARGAARDLFLHRAIGWVAATAYFLGIAIWSLLPGLTR